MQQPNHMTAFKKVVIGVLILFGVPLGYCYLTSYTWHQKLTIEVEVDGQLYSGSSVGSVGVMRSDPITSQLGSPFQKGSRGEAAYVALPGQRYVFALLNGGPRGSDLGNIAIHVFEDLLPKSTPELFVTLSNLRLMQEVPSEYYPLLVTFTDINDPKTIQKVNPENLAATLGSGVALKRITLEITDEPVTEGKIESVLEWLNDPAVLKNPGWRNLPSLAQTTIYGLRKPIKVKEN